MSKQNPSRYYYISNENMSDIKESIEEYSMKFDRESQGYGNSRSEIAEMISGSHQATLSRPNGSRPNIQVQSQQLKTQQTIQQQPMPESNMQAGGIKDKPPVYLGQHIFKVIQQRYYETTKLSTEDPQVLYNYFLAQRKVPRTKQIKDQDIQRQMPSMQRKMLIKKQFNKILDYYPQDVYYSLHCQIEKMKKDRELKRKVQVFNYGHGQDKKKITKKQMDKIVDKLYNTKGEFNKGKGENLTPQEIQKRKRTKFGRNLSEYFQNHYREKGAPANVQTVDKLHSLWEDTYERQEYDIQWDEQTCKIAIEQYMYEQIEDLMAYANKKLGFKCGKAISLLKVYQQNIDKIDNIFIPLNSFEEYVKVYNEVQRRKIQNDIERAKQYEKKEKQRRKKSELKKFGRPVSATPVTILAQPKTQNTLISDVASKYPKDKLIKTLLTQDQIKKPRFSFEYGVYDIKQQVKLKQWVKINLDKKYDQSIHNNLVKTFTNPQFFNTDQNDQVSTLLQQQDLQKQQTWKQLWPTLQQAMLVKGHSQGWFRECVVRYVDKVVGGDNKGETNQVVFKKLFGFLNGLDEDERRTQIRKLQAVISTSEDIAQKTKKIQQMTKDPSKNNQNKQRRLLLFKLEEKAIDFVRMRIQKKNNDKFILRKYLKDLFDECMKEHKDYVKKHYNVVDGDKQCPKLLKYEFFRIVKEINPITLQREPMGKNYAWVPTNQVPTDFGTKTFNSYAEYYWKDKNYIYAQPEKPELKTSLWGRGKGKDRENLMMTYKDAEECTFHPKISKRM